MKKRIISLVLMSTLTLSVLSGCSDKSKQVNTDVEEDYVPVSVEEVGPKDIAEKITFSGELVANQEVSITPKIPGKVVSLNVDVGSQVNAGQVLFSLDKKDLQNQVDQAKKSVELAKAGYETTKEQVAQAGKQVDLAESGYESTKEQVAQAEKSVELAKTNYEKAKEQVDNAKINLERTKKLYEAGVVSKSEYEQAELAASDKSLDTLKVQIEQAQLAASNTPLNSARIQIEQARLGATDSGLKAASLQVEQAELGYKQALDALADANVTAPTSGVISLVNLNVGEMASNAQPSIVIVDTSKMYVEIDVPENVVNNISVGQDVSLEIPSTNDVAKGVIEIISPITDERTQLYSVKILINDVTENVRSGMFAKASLDTNLKENVIAIKGESIIEDGTKSYVYIVNENKAVKKEVEIGVDSGEYVEILKGIKNGEQVLVKGQDYVEDGSIVKIIRGEK